MIKLRLATSDDFSKMLEIYRPYVENTRISFEYAVPTEKEFAQRIEKIAAKHPVVVLEDDGKVCGYSYTADAFERAAYAWSAELSVYVESTQKRKGFGRLLVAAAEEIARALGYRKLYSLVTEENAASLAFHKALGYRQIALFPEQGYKFGEWVGVVWLEKELNGREVAFRVPPAISCVERGFIDKILNNLGEDNV